MVGFLHWLNLRRRVERSLWWVAANVAGWTIGLGLYPPVAQLAGWLIGFAVSGVVAGSIIAAAVVMMLRRPVFEPPAETPLKDDYQSS
jgi:hypothetical protein